MILSAPQTSIRVFLSCDGPVEAGFTEALRKVILRTRGEGAEARISLLQRVVEDE